MSSRPSKEESRDQSRSLRESSFVCVVEWRCLLSCWDGSAFAPAAADASGTAGTADAEHAEHANDAVGLAGTATGYVAAGAATGSAAKESAGVSGISGGVVRTGRSFETGFDQQQWADAEPDE